MPSSIETAVQRSKSYWLRDGIPDIVLGLYFALAGVLFALEAVLGEKGRSLSAYGLPIVIIGGTLALAPIIRVLKRRITYPRTGYVVHRQDSPGRRGAFGLVGAVAVIAVIAGVILLSSGGAMANVPLAPLATGAILSVGFLVAGIRSSQRRLFLVAVTASASVALGASLTSDDTIGMAVLFVAVGCVQALLGFVVLSRYLASTTLARPDEDSDDVGGPGTVQAWQPR